MLAYVVYKMVAIYTVDLDGQCVEVLDLYAAEMKHLDTALGNPAPQNWRALHRQAEGLVEGQPRVVAPRWSAEE